MSIFVLYTTINSFDFGPKGCQRRNIFVGSIYIGLLSMLLSLSRPSTITASESEKIINAGRAANRSREGAPKCSRVSAAGLLNPSMVKNSVDRSSVNVNVSWMARMKFLEIFNGTPFSMAFRWLSVTIGCVLHGFFSIRFGSILYRRYGKKPDLQIFVDVSLCFVWFFDKNLNQLIAAICRYGGDVARVCNRM